MICMAEIALHRGSEWHLMRLLGRHRRFLDSRLAAAFETEMIEWLDYPVNPLKPSKDQEWEGLKFLPESMQNIRSAWEAHWPRTGSEMNWDAVAWSRYGPRRELLLFEAKANLNELHSNCGAKAQGGLPAIRSALDAAKTALNVDPSADWLRRYYQYANRLVVLNFLVQHGLPTRMIFIYFTGDENGSGCPKSREDWLPALEKQKAHLGLDPYNPIQNLHEIFIPICPA